jgi:hypothetical protein
MRLLFLRKALGLGSTAMERNQSGSDISMGARWRPCIPFLLTVICPAEAFERQAIIKTKVSDSMETHPECTSTDLKS